MPATAKVAAPTATITVGEYVHTSDECKSHPFSYAVSGLDPAYPNDWKLTVSAANDTDGDTVFDTVTSYKSQPLPQTGSGAFSFCPWTMSPGTYTVIGKLRYGVPSAKGSSVPDEVEVDLPSTTFVVRNQRSAATLTIKKKAGKLKGVVLSYIAEATRKPHEGAAVRVQYYYKGMWIRLKSGETNNRGEVVFTAKQPRGATRFRAMVSGTEYVDGATSKTVRVR